MTYTVKLLGIPIYPARHSKLTFNKHVSQLCNKAPVKIMALFRITLLIDYQKETLL